MLRLSMISLALTLATCASPPKEPASARAPSSKTPEPVADAKECQQRLLGPAKR